MMADLRKLTFHFSSRFERARCVSATCNAERSVLWCKFVGVPVLANWNRQRFSHWIYVLALDSLSVLPTSLSAYLAFIDLTKTQRKMYLIKTQSHKGILL